MRSMSAGKQGLLLFRNEEKAEDRYAPVCQPVVLHEKVYRGYLAISLDCGRAFKLNLWATTERLLILLGCRKRGGRRIQR